MRRFCRSVTVLLILVSLLVTPLDTFAASDNDDKYCYEMARSVTQATIDYLNEVYIDKYPNLGTDYLYGTPADKAALQTMTDKIVSGLTTDRQKLDAIVNWVSQNITYRSMYADTYLYPIDVFYHREGNCVGTSQLIRHMARSINIPVVACDGTRGNMKENIKLGTRSTNHEWVMAYVDNEWLLYDPLFDVFGTSDKEFISKWYFTDLIEGISPYYEGMDYQYVNDGNTIYYVNGRFMHYIDGAPAGQNNPSKCGASINGCISYFANTLFDYCTMTYLENPERRQEMIYDQCFTNGWLTNGSSLEYAKENGTLIANQFVEKDGRKLFAAYSGTMLEIIGYTDNIETTEGYLTVHKDIDNFKLIPVWAEGERNKGRVIAWENESEDIVEVDNDGNITVLGEGLATLLVMSRNPGSEGHFYAEYVQIYVTRDGYREYSYAGIANPEITTIKTPVIASDGITVKWTKNTTGSGYYIYRSVNGAGYKKVKTITSNATVSWKDTGAKNNGNKYQYKIIAYKTVNGKTYKSDYSSVKTIYYVSRPAISSATNSAKRKMTVKWGKNAKATGYQIQYSTKSGFSSGNKSVAVTKASTVSKSITGLTKGKTYYVRVRAYKTVNGTKYYSAWSAKKTVKIKK